MTTATDPDDEQFVIRVAGCMRCEHFLEGSPGDMTSSEMLRLSTKLATVLAQRSPIFWQAAKTGPPKTLKTVGEGFAKLRPSSLLPRDLGRKLPSRPSRCGFVELRRPSKRIVCFVNIQRVD